MPPISDTSTPVGTELLSDAKNLGSSAVNRLYSEADARKGDAVTQVQAISSTMERAVDSLEPNAPTWLKSALEQGAEQVKNFATTLEQNDSRQMFSQISQFAKNSPATFLGACAVAGFAAARVFRAGSDQNSATQLDPVSPLESSSSDWSANASTQSPVGSNAAAGEFV